MDVFLYTHLNPASQENEKIEIPMDYADKFKELGEQIKFFRDDFDKYLKDQGKVLSDQVKDLQAKLKTAEDTAKKCVPSSNGFHY